MREATRARWRALRMSPPNLDRSLLHAPRAGQEREQARLADAVWADETDELSLADLERNAVERGAPSVAKSHAGEARDGRAGRRDLRLRSLERGFRDKPLRARVVELLRRGGPAGARALGAIEAADRKGELVPPLRRERGRGRQGALAHRDLCARRGDGLPRHLQQRSRLGALGVERVGLHADERIAGADEVAFIGEDLLDPPGGLGRDVDLGGLDAPVPDDKSRGNRLARGAAQLGDGPDRDACREGDEQCDPDDSGAHPGSVRGERDRRIRYDSAAPQAIVPRLAAAASRSGVRPRPTRCSGRLEAPCATG